MSKYSMGIDFGTSTCHILLGETACYVPGISGYVKDGIVDGLYAEYKKLARYFADSDSTVMQTLRK